MVHWKALIARGAVLLLGAVVLRAQSAAPVPAAPPSRVTVAACMMIQVVQQLHDCVASQELTGIHQEDLRLASAVTTLLQESATVSPERGNELQLSLTQFGREVAELHVAADAGQQAQSEQRLQVALATFEKIKALYGADVLQPAQALADRRTCPMHFDVTGRPRDLCPKCGMVLDQPVRPSLLQTSGLIAPARTIKATVATEGALVPGQPTRCTLHLSNLRGEPVSAADLFEAHTRRIHLLIVDPSLTDYHHEHPEPLPTQGDYTFIFTPKKAGPYRLWADVRPRATGFQEYATVDFASSEPGESLTDRAEKLETVLAGRRFQLEFAKPQIKAGEAVAAKLRVTNADGTPCTQLEPVMASFAHLVGFSEDYRTVVHLHPKGAEIRDPNARGGPELELLFYADKPGFIRLFAQVQIDGLQHFAPFGVSVAP